jgi:hypothetical protein
LPWYFGLFDRDYGNKNLSDLINLLILGVALYWWWGGPTGSFHKCAETDSALGTLKLRRQQAMKMRCGGSL